MQLKSYSREWFCKACVLRWGPLVAAKTVKSRLYPICVFFMAIILSFYFRASSECKISVKSGKFNFNYCTWLNTLFVRIHFTENLTEILTNGLRDKGCKHNQKHRVLRVELTLICVAQSFLQHFAPFELHINIKTLLNTPPYQKYTFSERKLHEESKYDIQKCVGGRVRMSVLRKSIFLDQIWNFPSCVISPYSQPLLPIYHQIWIPYEIPLQKMYTWTGFELTIEKLRCLKSW